MTTAEQTQRKESPICTAASLWNPREIFVFGAITFGVMGALHGALAASGTRFSVESPWGILYLAGLLSPSAAALIIERRQRGRAGVRALLELGRPRSAERVQLAGAVLAPVGLTGAAVVLAGGGGSVDLDVAMTLGQVWVVYGEEFGWRGWLWPRLTERLGVARGTLFVTALWAMWHLPMFVVKGSPQADDGVVAFSAAIAAWGLLHGVLQRKRRSVFAAMVFHAAANISVSTISVDRTARVVVHALAAATVVAWLWRDDRATRRKARPRRACSP